MTEQEFNPLPPRRWSTWKKAIAVSLKMPPTREQQRQFTGNASKVLQSLLSTVLEAGPWAPNLVDAAALCNVRKVVRELREEASPALLEPQRRGALRVVGAYYHLDTGRVDFLAEER